MSKRSFLGCLLAVLFGSLLFSATVAQAKSTTSQGFKTNQSVSEGAVVCRNKDDAQLVEMSTLDNRDRILGVAVKADESLVVLNDGSSRIQVVSSGLTEAQVSTSNGEIVPGDALSVSPISGVAVKAITSGKIIGIAQDSFTEEPGTGKTQVSLKDSKGKTTTVQVGSILVNVGVVDWAPTNEPNSPFLNGLRSMLGGAVGKPVSNAQALLCFAIIVLAILASATILYSAVSSSIHSIGRNPLSKTIIRRSLVVMIILVVVIIIGAGAAVYLILGG